MGILSCEILKKANIGKLRNIIILGENSTFWFNGKTIITFTHHNHFFFTELHNVAVSNKMLLSIHCHDITEILLEVALNTIFLPLTIHKSSYDNEQAGNVLINSHLICRRS
jgi:hypothetical protein